MNIITSIRAMQQEADRLRSEGIRIACVPTMGYLHEGHLSLVRTARMHADIVIVTIFVNPTQFAPNEDFSRYPRDLSRDIELLKKEGTEYVFAPSNEEVYPAAHSTVVRVDGITSTLEGASRPTHFQGVTTVVAKLLNITKPHVMVLGQKDAQQIAVLKRMSADLNFDAKIVVSPTVREAGGLALSSRNTYLSEQERVEALAISRSLFLAKQMFESGVRDTETLRTAVESEITKTGALTLDYAAVVDPDTFSAPADNDTMNRLLIAVAARIGNVRLIDNILLGSEAE